MTAKKKDLFNQKDEILYLKTTWDRMKKFLVLSTGVKITDAKIRNMFGPWLTIEEERSALRREISRLKVKGLENKDYEARLLELKTAGPFRIEPINHDAVYEVSIKKIPFHNVEKDTHGIMKLRQITINTFAFEYKVTYRRGKLKIDGDRLPDTFSIVSGGKKLFEYEEPELRVWLATMFGANTVHSIMCELWE